jgi:hypothetical protein
VPYISSFFSLFGEPLPFAEPSFVSSSILLSFCVLFFVLAPRADAPESDFDLVEDEAMVLGRLEAWGGADGAVDIFDRPASAADQVVVVVADPRFIERGGIRGFDAPYQSHFQQGMKIIINGLPGKAAQAFTGSDGNGLGVEMSAPVDRRQYGETGCRYSHPNRPQPFLEQFPIC